MSLRAWEEQDLIALSEIEQRCFSDPWSLQALQSAFAGPFHHNLVSQKDGVIQGYVCLFVLFEEAEIQNIAVDIPFRKQGIGRELLKKAHENAKALGAEICFLEVRASNFKAISLYQSEGYEIYGERSKYYEDGESALVMKKNLKDE